MKLTENGQIIVGQNELTIILSLQAAAKELVKARTAYLDALDQQKDAKADVSPALGAIAERLHVLRSRIQELVLRWGHLVLFLEEKER